VKKGKPKIGKPKYLLEKLKKSKECRDKFNEVVDRKTKEFAQVD